MFKTCVGLLKVVVAKLNSFSPGINNARSSLMLTAGQCEDYSCSRRRNTPVVPRHLSSPGVETPQSSQLSPAPSSLSSAQPLTSNSLGEEIGNIKFPALFKSLFLDFALKPIR